MADDSDRAKGPALNIPSSRSPAFSRFDDAASHWFDLSVMRQDTDTTITARKKALNVQLTNRL